MMSVRETSMIEIHLSAPTTPDEQQLNIVGDKSLPYMDSDGIEEQTIEPYQQSVHQWPPTPIDDDGKPKLKFYAVGPSTYHIRCPLCKQRADTETVTMTGILAKISCLLSCFSCCFPILTLAFVYNCVQSRLATKRLFCNSCGGHLGFYYRPT